MNHTVRIPIPCDENPDSMASHEKGWFCKACSKVVYDFTGKSDEEIHMFFMAHRGQEVCGRFRNGQLNRPLYIQVPLHHIPSGLSSTNMCILALFFVFGTMLFSCTNENGQKITGIELVDTRDSILVREPSKLVHPDSLSVTEIVSVAPGENVLLIYEEITGGAVSYEIAGILPDPIPPINIDTVPNKLQDSLSPKK